MKSQQHDKDRHVHLIHYNPQTPKILVQRLVSWECPPSENKMTRRNQSGCELKPAPNMRTTAWRRQRPHYLIKAPTIRTLHRRHATITPLEHWPASSPLISITSQVLILQFCYWKIPLSVFTYPTHEQQHQLLSLLDFFLLWTQREPSHVQLGFYHHE